MNLYLVTLAYVTSLSPKYLQLYVVAMDMKQAGDAALARSLQKEYMYDYISDIKIVAETGDYPRCGTELLVLSPYEK